MLLRILVISLTIFLTVQSRRNTQGDVPPPPKHRGNVKLTNMIINREMDQVMREINGWKPSDKQNIWELSGLLEGDIMTDSGEESAPIPDGVSRNALRSSGAKWPGGIVPYHISEDFEEDEADLIRGAMDEFHDNSCIKFRPYRKGDSNWVTIQGDSPGCWSYVGRRSGGQVVNLGNRCVQHGVAAHELLHALGFHHQQSASDRDRYVSIHWNNIRRGTERNFKKYDSGRVTDFGVGYDFDSVMHYSTHAFSKNGQPTITPKEDGASIGQRSRLSDKDLEKLNIMYNCNSGGGGNGGSGEDDYVLTDFVKPFHTPSFSNNFHPFSMMPPTDPNMQHDFIHHDYWDYKK